MPVKKCKKGGKPGYQWGSQKCYTYGAGSESGMKAARKKAHAQGYAIKQSEYTESVDDLIKEVESLTNCVTNDTVDDEEEGVCQNIPQESRLRPTPKRLSKDLNQIPMPESVSIEERIITEAHLSFIDLSLTQVKFLKQEIHDFFQHQEDDNEDTRNLFFDFIENLDPSMVKQVDWYGRSGWIRIRVDNSAYRMVAYATSAFGILEIYGDTARMFDKRNKSYDDMMESNQLDVMSWLQDLCVYDKSIQLDESIQSELLYDRKHDNLKEHDGSEDSDSHGLDLNMEWLESLLGESVEFNNWVAPPIEEVRWELKTEGYMDDPSGVSMDDLTVVGISNEDIEKMQRGIGETPPTEWLLDPGHPEAQKHSSYSGKYRFDVSHHEDEELIPRLLNNQPVYMPVLIREKSGKYTAVSGRHRISYAHSLRIPVKAVVLDSDIVDQVSESTQLDESKKLINFFSGWDYWDKTKTLERLEDPEVKSFVSKYKVVDPVTVFRGLRYQKDLYEGGLDGIRETLKAPSLKEGVKFVYHDKDLSSWSHSYDAALSFATEQGRGHDDVGIVIKSTIDPEKVVMDFDKITEPVRSKYNLREEEREVMVLPGSFHSEIVFFKEVQLESIQLDESKKPTLMELEVEEAWDVLKDDPEIDTGSIVEVWESLFMRAPTTDEIHAVETRLAEKGPKRYTDIATDNHTRQIADAYRSRYGDEYDPKQAQAISMDLFGKGIEEDAATRVMALIKLREPDKMDDLYRLIAREVMLLMKQNPDWDLDQAYEKLVLRPPFEFERQAFEEIDDEKKTG